MANINNITQNLSTLGFQFVPGRASNFYKGTLRVGKINVPMELEIPDFSFIDLPIIHVCEEFSLEHGLRGHLTEGNTLCYTDDNILTLDLFNPIGSIKAVLDLSVKTLNELLHGNSEPAIRAEITAYWKGDLYYVIDDLSGLNKAAMGYIENSDGQFIRIIASSEKSIIECAKNAGMQGVFSQELSVIIIKRDIPSPPNIKNLEEASQWIDNIQTEKNRPLLRPSLKQEKPAIVIIGNNGIIGLIAKANATIDKARKGQGFRKSSLQNLWKSQGASIEIKRFYGRLSTFEEIISRNTNKAPACKNKRICLIGCGTIGGYLARMLIQNGAGFGATFTVVDNQVFMPENMGRHILGFSDIGKMKAKAVASKLVSDFPSCKIESITESAQKIWGQFRQYDLIIDATGSERFSSALNIFAKKQRSIDKFPAIIYSMIFGNGAAVQSFLDKGRDEDACYQCLHPEYGQPWRFNPLKNKPSEIKFAVRPCSVGSFTPFGVEASISAATLTLRQVLDFFGSKTSLTLRTQVIDDQMARNIRDKTIKKIANCPACQQLNQL